MAQAGDVTYRIIRVEDASGAAVTGLTTASFTFAAYGRGYGASVWSTYTSNAAIVEIGSGLYSLVFNLPASAGWFDFYVTPVSAANFVHDRHWSGEIETMDLDAVYTGIARGTVLPTTTSLLGSVLPGELVAYRYNKWQIPVVDANGAAIDLTTYSNLALSVRSVDQTTKKLDATNGSPTGFVLTGSAGGILTVEWPESTGTLGTAADIYSAVPAASLEAATLYYEVVGDYAATSTKTVPIIRSSPLTITRREVGS